MGFVRPGYTQIPNELIDEWMKKMGDAMFKVMVFICRKTFGYHKTKDRISGSQIAEGCGLTRRSVVDILPLLEELGLIKINGDSGRINEIELVIEAGPEKLLHTSDTAPGKLLHTPWEITSHPPGKLLHTQKKEYKETIQKNNTGPAEELLAYLNSRAGKSFRKLHPYTTARLKEYTLDDLKLVVDYKVMKWAGDPKSREWLRQETLFAPTHIDTYLCEARETTECSQRTKYEADISELYSLSMTLPIEQRKGMRPPTFEEWKNGKRDLQRRTRTDEDVLLASAH